MASRARFLLSELPEVDVPFGVSRPVMAEIAGQMRRPRPSTWRARLSWAFAAAAAAAIVVLVATNGQRLIEGGGAGGGGEVPAAAPSAAFDSVTGAEAQDLAALEVQPDANYDPAKVEALAADVAAQVSGGAEAAPRTAAATPEATAAFECVLQGSGLNPADPNERLVRLIDAKYEGRPAYLGVFVESPGAGQPPTKVIVWIVAKNDCSKILSYASRRI
ncbi:MAG: hypothetical protein HYU54_02805 [Actinobacteria bacterium]|nr:hypothetical protein [Actinomycetota bacterium]